MPTVASPYLRISTQEPPAAAAAAAAAARRSCVVCNAWSLRRHASAAAGGHLTPPPRRSSMCRCRPPRWHCRAGMRVCLRPRSRGLGGGSSSHNAL
eukprot:365360-Chlamydomonas_euryale.AAC.7